VSEICRATSIKNPGFLQLLTQCIVESGFPMPDKEALSRLESAVRQDRVRYYMSIEEGNRVVGVVSLTMGFSAMTMEMFGIIGDLYVHPGHRGRGTAARLLFSAMDNAHAEGCGFVQCHTAGGMEGLFARAGWAETKASLRYDIDREGPPPSLSQTGSWRSGWD